MEKQSAKIRFVDSTVALTHYCFSQAEFKGIDFVDAAKKLTKNGQKIFLFRTPQFKQIALEKVEDNRFRFVVEPESFIICPTNYSAVFSVIPEKTEWEEEWRI